MAFEVGLVYSSPSTRKKEKIYYVAIQNKTLVTHRNGQFGKYSCNKSNHSLENNISVADLCDHWNINLSDFDSYMASHFAPDIDAKQRARRSRGDE